MRRQSAEQTQANLRKVRFRVVATVWFVYVNVIPNGEDRSKADLNSQTLVLALEHSTNYIAVGRLLIQRLWVPLTTRRVKEITAIDMYSTRESQQRIRDRMDRIGREGSCVTFEQRVSSKRL